MEAMASLKDVRPRGPSRTIDAALDMNGLAIVPLITAGSEVADEIRCGDVSFIFGFVGLVRRAGCDSTGCDSDAGKAGTLKTGDLVAFSIGGVTGVSFFAVTTVFSQSVVTEVTTPPFPPLADRMSYFLCSRSGSFRANLGGVAAGFFTPSIGDIATLAAAYKGDMGTVGDGKGGEG